MKHKFCLAFKLNFGSFVHNHMWSILYENGTSEYIHTIVCELNKQKHFSCVCADVMHLILRRVEPLSVGA